MGIEGSFVLMKLQNNRQCMMKGNNQILSLIDDNYCAFGMGVANLLQTESIYRLSRRPTTKRSSIQR